MAQKYLDSNGLAYFWQKIKAYGNTHWGGGSSVEEIFIATINETTYQEVADALDAGKMVFAVTPNSYNTINVYPYAYTSLARFIFIRGHGESEPQNKIVTLFADDSWTTVTENLQSTTLEYRSQTSLADKSIAGSGSWVMLGSFTPPEGMWHIRACAIFPSNATGRRIITLSRTSGAFGTALSTNAMQAVNGYQTYLQTEITDYFDGSTPLYINVAQSSGTALTVGARYSMWKLGDTYRSV